MKSVSILLTAFLLAAAVSNGSFAQKLKESTDPYFKGERSSRSILPKKQTQPMTEPARDGEFAPESQANQTSNLDVPMDDATDGALTSRPKTVVEAVPDFKRPKMTSRVSNQPAQAISETNDPIQNSSDRGDPPAGQAFEPSRVLARVGSEPIFVSDLSVEAMQIVDQFLGDAPDSVKLQQARKLMPRLLPKYIQAKLLLVDAMESLPEGANIEEIFDSAGKQFDETMLPRMMESAGVKSPVELDAYYRALGSSLRKVRKSWSETELVKYLMREKINVDPHVSHREMYDYYVQHKDEYALPAKVRWEKLMVRFDQFPTRAAARQALAEMGDEVVYGAPFQAVAKRSSQGYKAEEGGQQGWTTRGSLVDKELDDLLFTIEPGELSQIIQTNRGFVIVRVHERQEAGFTPFKTAQKEIREKLVAQKRDEAFQKHVAEVRERIPVKIFEPEMVAEGNDQSFRR